MTLLSLASNSEMFNLCVYFCKKFASCDNPFWWAENVYDGEITCMNIHKLILFASQLSRRSGVQLPERLASFSIMGAQLSFILKPHVHHSNMIPIGGLRGSPKWSPIMPRGMGHFGRPTALQFSVSESVRVLTLASIYETTLLFYFSISDSFYTLAVYLLKRACNNFVHPWEDTTLPSAPPFMPG